MSDDCVRDLGVAARCGPRREQAAAAPKRDPGPNREPNRGPKRDPGPNREPKREPNREPKREPNREPNRGGRHARSARRRRGR